MDKCPINFLSCSYSYRYLNCRCIKCKKVKYLSEDRKVRLKRNYDWKKAHPEFRSFEAMKKRCNNPNDSHYKNYGARGIKVLINSWQEIITTIGPKPGKEYSIDRIDNNGNYTLNNIRWATMKQQSNNRRKRK